MYYTTCLKSRVTNATTTYEINFCDISVQHKKPNLILALQILQD